MGKMITLKTDGTVEEIEAIKSVGLETVQQAVGGGLIEAVAYFNKYKGDPCQAWCNEEGKLRGYEPNAQAQRLWFEADQDSPRYDHLVGDIVILTGKAMLD